MNLLSMCIKSKSLLLGFLFITLNCCDVSEPVLDPDYTGQIGQVTDIDGNIYKSGHWFRFGWHKI
jgi:hypothetical protein